MKHLSTMKHINLMKYINTMKHIFTISYRKSLICAVTLLIALGCPVPLHSESVTYSGTETIYFNRYPSRWSWFGNDYGNGAAFFAYFYGESGFAWSCAAMPLPGDDYWNVLMVNVPKGTWDHMILIRQDAGSYEYCWPEFYKKFGGKDNNDNQSADIELQSGKNYLTNFRNKSDGNWDKWEWSNYSMYDANKPDGIGNTSKETVEVCQQSIDNNDVYSLLPLWTDDKSGYREYHNHVLHVWARWVGDHWVPVSDNWDDFNEHLIDQEKTYYYLFTTTSDNKRFICLERKACAVNSVITSFEYVLTPVNVKDSTYSVEGMVAFSSTAPGKTLEISCDGKSDSKDEPESPCTFSISGLKADGKTKTIVVRYIGVVDEGGPIENRSHTFTAPVPTSGVGVYPSTDELHYVPAKTTYIHSEASLTSPIKLIPSPLTTDSFSWADSKDSIWASSQIGGDNFYNFTNSYGFDTTIVLYYTEYNLPPVFATNMMGNGDFKDAEYDYASTSDYTYTGKIWDGSSDDKRNVYNHWESSWGDSHMGIFGITTNANVFWFRMANVAPKKEAYFEVIDGDKEEKVAWKATTDPIKNPKLTLVKGTTYMFSFWVANVNNYGEMVNRDNINNARLQFKIEYTDTDGGSHVHYLGNEINLNEYKDNLWHQNSATFTSDYDADDVTISVVDKNTSNIPLGNDFALDDIRFRAVSVQSGTIRTRERFELKFVEPAPEVKDVTIEPVTYPACGDDKFSFKVNFKYKTNTPHTINLNISVSGFAGEVGNTTTLTNTAGEWVDAEYVFATTSSDPSVTTDTDIRARTGTMKATVNVSVTDAKSVTRSSGDIESDAVTIPRTPVLTLKEGHGATSIACAASTFSVAVKTAYTYFHGDKIRVKWDGTEKTDLAATITKRSTTAIDYETTVTGLTADGKKHTLLIYTGNSLDCEKEIEVIAPKGNSITAFAVSAIEPACDETKYKLHATWTVTKADVSGSVYDNLIIAKKNADNSLTTLKTIPAASVASGEADLDGQEYDLTPATHPTIVAYLEERYARDDECYTTAAGYDHPVVPQMEVGTPTFDAIECNKSTFNLVVPVTYTNQHGDMYIWVDSKTPVKVTDAMCKTGAGLSVYTKDTKSSLVTKVVITNLELTGEHYVNVMCDGEGACARTKANGKETSFPAPILPSVDRVFKSYSTPTCNDPYTTLTFDFKYANQPAGTIEMWVDDDKTSGHMITLVSASGGYTPTAALKTLENQKIKFVPADSLDTHILHIKSGSCDETFTLPQVLFMPKIEDVSVSCPTTLTCGASDKYTATVTVTSSNYRNAALCVSLNDGTPQEKNPNSGSQTFTFTDLPANGSSNTVKAWFKCVGESCNQTETFTAPTLPKASVVLPESMPAVAACDQPTFDLTFDLKYTYQDGELQVWVARAGDATKYGLKTFTASASDGDGKYIKLDKDEQTKTITLTGLPSDGRSDYKLYFKFDKSGYCGYSSPIETALSTFPRSPTITAVAVSGVPDKVADCTVETYDATVTVTYKYTSGEKIIIAYTDKDGVVKTCEPVTLTTSPQDITLDDVLNDIGKGSKSLEVYFQKSPVDFSSCHHTATYKAPSNSSINSGYDVTVTNTSACGERKYNLSGTVTYVGEATGNLHVVFKVGETVIKDSVIAKANYSSSGTAFTMTGMTAAVTGHSLIAYFEDQPKCTAASESFDSPDVCGFDAPIANMIYSTPACGETKTTLTFDLNYTYQKGDKLQVWVDEGTKLDVAFDANENKEKTITGIEIPGVDADGAVHTLHVMFVNGRCPEKTFTTPSAPFNPKPSAGITSVASKCDNETKAKVVYTSLYADQYRYKIDDGSWSEWKAINESKKEFDLDIDGLSAGDYTLTFQTRKESTECVSDPTEPKPFNVWPLPEITTLENTTICEGETVVKVPYAATNASTFSYQVLDGATPVKTVATATIADGKINVDISGLTTGGAATKVYTLSVTAKSGHDCETASPETADITLKVKPKVTLSNVTNTCAGTGASITVYYTDLTTTELDYIVRKGVVATSVSGSKTGLTPGDGSFEISGSDLEGLSAGTNYEVEITAIGDNGCTGDEKFKAFTIYPLPTVAFNSGYEEVTVCEGREDAVFELTTSDNASTYSYETGTLGLTATDQPVVDKKIKITLPKANLKDGDFTLTVTVKSAAPQSCPSVPATAILHVNNRPWLKIDDIAAQCHPTSLFTVSYTQTDAKYIKWTVDGKITSEQTHDVPQVAPFDYSFTINTSGWEAGTYTMRAKPVSSLDCDSAYVVKTFTINEKPTVSNIKVTEKCEAATMRVEFDHNDAATHFEYWITPGTKHGAVTAITETATPGKAYFDADIRDLVGGNYTIRVQTSNPTTTCVSADNVIKDFEIWPLPVITTLENTTICEGETVVKVPYAATNATSFSYQVLDGATPVKTVATATVAAGKIEVDISGLTTGGAATKVYTLSVTAKSGHDCETASPETADITLKVKPKVTLSNVTNTCAGTGASITVYYTDLTTTELDYIVRKGVVATSVSGSKTGLTPGDGSFEISGSDLEGLSAGTNYEVEITAIGDNGCTGDEKFKAFTIYPLPTVAFNSGYEEVTVCEGREDAVFELTTSDNASTYSYETGTLGLTATDQPVVDKKIKITLPKANLKDGDFTLTVTVKSAAPQSCPSVPATAILHVNNRPWLKIDDIAAQCHPTSLFTVSYTQTDAKYIKWTVDGKITTEQTHTVPNIAPYEFTINAAGWAVGTYTLRARPVSAYDCDSAVVEKEFEILPIPTVTFDPDATVIRTDVTNVDVTLNFTNTTTCDYSFVDDHDNVVHSQIATGELVSNNQLKLHLNTTGITKGTYTLKVTPYSATCDGSETELQIVVNDKPYVLFGEQKAACVNNPEVEINYYDKSPDAARFVYNIEKDGTPLWSTPKTYDFALPLTISKTDLFGVGTYTLTGHAESVKADGTTTLEKGDDETVEFVVLAQLEKKDVSQPTNFIGCADDDKYTATIEVKIFNAAGRTIIAEYLDNGIPYSKSFDTNVGDETAILTLPDLKDVGATAGQMKSVTVYIDGVGCGIPIEYEMPQLMTIEPDFIVEPQPRTCDATAYTIKGTVVANCNEGKIVVEYNDTYKDIVDANINGSDFTIADIPAGGSVTKLQAYFQDKGKTCGVVESVEFAEPTKPEAEIAYTPFVTPQCDVTTFNLEFSLNYKYQEEGTLTVWVEDFPENKKTFTSESGDYTALNSGWLTLNDKIEGLPADGRTGKKLCFKFDGAHSCDDEIALADFPNTPLIDTIIITGVPDLVPDENDPYQPTIKVAYERAKGQKIILEYFDKGDVAHRDTSNVLTADKDTCIFTGIDFNDVAVAGDRKVNAYFEGAAFDDCHEGGTHTAIYRAPSNSSIEFITSELINTSTCNTLRYNLKGTVQFVGSAVGDLIVELDGTTFMTKIPEADCTPNTPLSFEIKKVTVAIPAEGKKLKAYFSGIPGNPTYSTEVHHQPVIPTVKVENATYYTPQCNESVTSLTFDLKYIKQQGNLRLHLDGKEYAYTIDPATPLSLDDDTEQTATIVINNLPADLSVRDLWVWFDGATGCSKDFTMPQAPYSPKVKSHKAEITNIACDKDTYTLNVSFTVENSQGKDATLVFRGESVNVSTTDGTNYSHSFNNVARTYGDVTDDVVELSFAGNDADCNGALYSIAYAETPKPAISLTLAADQGTTTCSDRTYRLQGEIRYTYLDQTPEIWLDEEAHRAITVQTMQADEQVINLADLGINVPADGREHHVYIKPNGWADACSIDVPFNALQQPIITAAEVSGVPAFISCGETYLATVTVDYVHAFGKTITVACTDNGSIQTYTSAAITDNDGQTVITLPSLSDHDGVTALSIYVDDETCAYTSASITQPKLNTIEPDFAVNVSTTPCGVVDYAVWGTIKFNNAVGLGELIVKTEDGVQADVTIKTATSAEFRIEHYTVTGTAMQLTAYFENAATCSVLSAPFDSPDVPDLTLDGTAVDTVFTCGDKSYTVRVAFTPTNQSGTGYVLDSIANGAVRTVETINATATAAQFVIARPAKAEQHFVVVRYPATGCEVISEALDINAYTKPKPLISLTAIDRLCNNETELILPLVITQGDIDEATLTLTNSKGEKVITAADMSINVAHDTLSYNLPAQLAAGKYTARVDARDTLGCETSAAQSVEFAIDGVVFSKWTDVLLVDNEGGLFTGYQWYENDKQLEGKTDQVLYLPEGMSGKSYYCVLQTAEGAIYTCVSDFGDLPRSADNPKQPTANHITVLPNRVATNGAVTVHQSLDENLHLILMSATGKRVAEYTQQEATKLIDMPGVQGIYLLRIESDSDVQTVKIVVY